MSIPAKVVLDRLMKSPSVEIRAAIAHEGYGLSTLAGDSSPTVRCEVARHGYALPKLVNDNYWTVRQIVASMGYGLSKLIDDPNHDVRIAVANQYYGLDKLIADDNNFVRAAVAKRGFKLNQLIHDSDPVVQWAVLMTGYRTNWIKDHINGNAQFIQTINDILSIDFANLSEEKKIYYIHHEMYLERFIHDENPSIRAEVACRRYGLNRLIKDPDLNIAKIARKIWVEGWKGE